MHTNIVWNYILMHISKIYYNPSNQKVYNLISTNLKDWKIHFLVYVNFKGCAHLSWSLLYTILHSHIGHN
jgi:hypothetical protein